MQGVQKGSGTLTVTARNPSPEPPVKTATCCQATGALSGGELVCGSLLQAPCWEGLKPGPQLHVPLLGASQMLRSGHLIRGEEGAGSGRPSCGVKPWSLCCRWTPTPVLGANRTTQCPASSHPSGNSPRKGGASWGGGSKTGSQMKGTERVQGKAKLIATGAYPEYHQMPR